MKLDYIILIVMIFAFLLSMNFITAADNNTDLDNNCLEIECDESISDSQFEDLQSLNQDNDSENIISTSSDESTDIYVSPDGKGSGTSQEDPADFESTLKDLEDNTVVHMLDGNYTWKFDNRRDTISIESSNIIIMAENYGKVMLNSTCSFASTEYVLDSCDNITFKNIIFQSSPSADYLFEITDSTNIHFEKCNFINYVNDYDDGILEIDNSQVFINNCYFMNDKCKNEIIEILPNSEYSLSILNCTFDKISSKYVLYISRGVSANIIGCNFINSNISKSTIDLGDSQKYANDVNISNCVFDLNSVSHVYGKVNNLTFKNNTVSSKYSINLIDGKINSPTTLTVLDNIQLTATSGDVINITAVLVDDMGNYINIPKIDFDIDGVTYSATYKDGVYSVEYTVPDVDQAEEKSFDSTPESTYLGNVNVIYPNPFLLIKPALNMSMDNISNSYYGDDITISVNISSLESGSLVYEFIKGNEVIKIGTDSFTNNVSTITVNDLPAGDYTVKVKYMEDENFGTTTVSKEFTVNKANSTVQIIIDSAIPVGDNITVQAVLPANATGNVTYRLKGENKTVNVTDSAVFAGLSEGNYTIYAVYNGDDNYNPSEEYNATFKVVKVDPKLVIEYSAPVINENVTVTVIMDKDITGDVNVTINKLDPVVKQVVNGTLTFNITNVPYGPQNITVSFKGNDKYNEMENNTSFFVNKLDVNLAIAADTVTYSEPLVVKVTANVKFSGDVIVKIGNRTETAHVVNGVGNATFNNLTAAEYFITATFTEDETFNADSKNTTAVVKGIEIPVDQAVDTTVPANSKSPTFSINLPEDATGNFTVSVDGKAVETKELVNGKASITVKDLSAGNHNISIAYTGDGKYAPITQNTTLTINMLSTSITASAVSTVYGVSKKLTITLKDANNKLLVGKTVKVVLNGVTYTRTTDAKGQVSITVLNNLAVKTYTAKVTFAGDSEYLNSAKDVKVTVKKATAKLTAKKATFKAKKKTKKYTVTLKANNKAVKKVKVTLKVKGKTYKATTNAKGKATFKITKLTKKGKHTATIKFSGNKNLKAATKKVKITIK
ncbi:MAG: Ig-like domain repeat protein [Methanosphaera stadtmanae]|jgi:hypothetical protein|nr:Ig-like domain repeat protein [Methanosphaera stadtmanae]